MPEASTIGTADSAVLIFDTAIDQLFQIFVLHCRRHPFFVIDLFIDVLFCFVTSFRHKNV